MAYFHVEVAYRDGVDQGEVGALVAFLADLGVEEEVNHVAYHSLRLDLRMIMGLEVHQQITDVVYQLAIVGFVLREVVQPRCQNMKNQLQSIVS